MEARVRFGDCELAPATGELFRRGRRVALAPQPAKLLALLVERRGELVRREEIRELLWPGSVFVEFEQGINFAVRQLREALHDSAARPRFIETLPRRGYRFVSPIPGEEAATVAAAAPPPPVSAAGAEPETMPAEQSIAVRRRGHRGWLAAAALVALASALVVALQYRPSAPGPRRAAVDALSPEAREAMARGLYLARRAGPEQVERGVGELRRAALLAPEAAEPLAALAQALLALHRYRPSPGLLLEAEATSSRAARLDAGSARAHLARAAIELAVSYDWVAAESEYRAALDLDPELVPARRGLATVLAARGRLDEAIAEARRVGELDPVCQVATADVAWYLFLARRWDEAVAAGRKALELDPANTLAHLTIVYSEMARGDDDAALAQANAQLAALFAGSARPAPRAPSLDAYWRGFVDYVAHDDLAAASELALPRLALGDDDGAIRLLLRGCRERNGRDPLFVAVNPLLARLRSDPRLREVVECVGLDPDGGAADDPLRNSPAVPVDVIDTVRG